MGGRGGLRASTQLCGGIFRKNRGVGKPLPAGWGSNDSHARRDTSYDALVDVLSVARAVVAQLPGAGTGRS